MKIFLNDIQFTYNPNLQLEEIKVFYSTIIGTEILEGSLVMQNKIIDSFSLGDIQRHIQRRLTNSFKEWEK